MSEREDEFRRRWPAETPWCDQHWRPMAVCDQLPGDPHQESTSDDARDPEDGRP